MLVCRGGAVSISYIAFIIACFCLSVLETEAACLRGRVGQHLKHVYLTVTKPQYIILTSRTLMKEKAKRYGNLHYHRPPWRRHRSRSHRTSPACVGGHCQSLWAYFHLSQGTGVSRCYRGGGRCY